MKTKLIILSSLLVFAASCTDDFEEFNRDPKNPATVPGEPLFSAAQMELLDQISSTNVNLNVFKLFVQHWTETTYTDETNYEIVNRTIPDLTFREYYRAVLRDFQEAYSIISATEPITEDDIPVKANKLAITDLMIVYSYQNLVDIFGDVPYSESGNIDNLAPVYDDAETIYRDLISRVNEALTQLDPTAGSFGSQDLIYRGDVAAWIKFANSLKLKLGITLADFDPDFSRSTVESAVAAGVFASRGEGAILQYLMEIHVNPLHEDLVLSGRDDFVPANTLVDVMNALEDPRRPLFFTTIGGVYRGGTYGRTTPYSQNSHIAERITEPDFPGFLLTYDEVLFYLAEAAARGFNVGGTPEAFYNAAITESITWWGGTPAEATTYLARPDVAYVQGIWQQRIGTQSWIAFYTRGLEAWTQWRRLDYPVLNMPPSIQNNYNLIPKRFTYPVNEQTLNKANYDAASANIGGDLLTTRIFWDVRNPVLPSR